MTAIKPRLCECGKEPLIRSARVPGAVAGTTECQVWVECSRCKAEGETYTGPFSEPTEAIKNWNSYFLVNSGSVPVRQEDVAG